MCVCTPPAQCLSGKCMGEDNIVRRFSARCWHHVLHNLDLKRSVHIMLSHPLSGDVSRTLTDGAPRGALLVKLGRESEDLLCCCCWWFSWRRYYTQHRQRAPIHSFIRAGCGCLPCSCKADNVVRKHLSLPTTCVTLHRLCRTHHGQANSVFIFIQSLKRSARGVKLHDVRGEQLAAQPVAALPLLLRRSRRRRRRIRIRHRRRRLTHTGRRALAVAAASVV